MSKIKLQSEYDDLDKYENYLGDIYYYKKNTHIFHNPYGPAIICKDGRKYYYLNNLLSRLDGPARIWSNGTEEYWINNCYLTKEQFETHLERLKYLGKEHLTCLI